MNEPTRNSPLDVCRILGIALSADNKIDDREIEALTEMRIGATLGVSAAEIRKVINDLCKEALVDESGRPNTSFTDLSTITEMTNLLGRNTPADRESVARLIEIINEADPTLFADQLLEKDRLNAALDRISDARLQLWTSCVLLRLLQAKGTVDDKEKALLSHVFKYWGISPETIST